MKKSRVPQKKQAVDWDRWDIKSALARKGYSLAKASRDNGYATSASEALRKPWPAMERVIADIIGVKPWEIWPSRYDDQHRPLGSFGAKRKAA